jgi:hypothetical protein
MENDDRFQLYLGFKISMCLRVFKDEIGLGVHLAFLFVLLWVRRFALDGWGFFPFILWVRLYN